MGLVMAEMKSERIRRDGKDGDILQAESGRNLKKAL
jgi:hypothetical protein